MQFLAHDFLKAKQRAERATHDPNLAIRVHRALSWLSRAETCEDIDGEFIFLWISFNAAYAQDLGDKSAKSTKETYRAFLVKLLAFDHDKRLYNLVWSEFTSSIRLLLSNRYVFQPYWDYENGMLDESTWLSRFNDSKTLANKALSNNDTVTIIGLVLDRLYTLRNQLIHGGATWDGKVNRLQLTDGKNFLGKLVPILVLLMLDNSKGLWGKPCYPVSGNSNI